MEIETANSKLEKIEKLVNVVGAFMCMWLVGVACGYAWCWIALRGAS